MVSRGEGVSRHRVECSEQTRIWSRDETFHFGLCDVKRKQVQPPTDVACGERGFLIRANQNQPLHFSIKLAVDITLPHDHDFA